jgi:arylsulfatase A-like enzyme
MKLQDMTFKQLKQELAVCKNPARELLIRNLMQQKYNAYKERKKTIEPKIYLKDSDFEESVPEAAPQEPVYEDVDKFTKKAKDHVNNNLMDRLNGDIDIQKINKKKKVKKAPKQFVSPFASNHTDKYAPFDDTTFKNIKKSFTT